MKYNTREAKRVIFLSFGKKVMREEEKKIQERKDDEIELSRKNKIKVENKRIQLRHNCNV